MARFYTHYFYITFTRRIIFCMFLVLSVQSLSAQHAYLINYQFFSQYVNPSSTGLFYGDNTNFKISTAYLSTALGGGIANYNTALVAYEKNLGKLGYGGMIMGENGNTGNHSRIQGMVSGAWEISIDPTYRHNLHAGMQIGVIQQAFNANKLVFGSQYNAALGNFDPVSESNENIQSYTALDVEAGIGAAYTFRDPTKLVNPYFGASLFQTFHTGLSFYDTPVDDPFRINVHLGSNISLGQKSIFRPEALYIYHAGAEVYSYGGDLLYGLGSGDSKILLGLFRNTLEMVVFRTGLYLRHADFFISYGTTTGHTAGNLGISTLSFNASFRIVRASSPSFSM